ncbi:MAG: YggS family pyridoxal phosphate-dependent enzyme [Planctomycetota bacterium]|nr:YggS family pyridoxal phosphate-dependent enzyme [Planctomycetota bacterium]
MPIDESKSLVGSLSVESVALQWSSVTQRVAEASKKSGRSPSEVTIVGITKYVDSQTAMWLWGAGCTDLGESRPQSLWEKQAALDAVSLSDERKIRWHFIGHLQRNKSLKTIANLSLLQSLDSVRLAQQVQRDAESLGISVDALVEVNVSGEPNKTGILSQDLPAVLDDLAGLDRIQVRGLMGMAGLQTTNPRTDFAKLRKLRDDMVIRFGDQFQLGQLSMGMSGDFEEAIEEGSTMVRIGSLLFEPIGS